MVAASCGPLVSLRVLAENGSINGTFDANGARIFAGKQAQIMTDLIVEEQRTQNVCRAYARATAKSASTLVR